MIAIYDIDGTLTTSDDMPNRPVIDYLNEDVEEEGVRIFILSGRPVSRLAETEDFLDENEIPYSAIYLNDFSETPGGEVGAAFKSFKLSKLVDEYGDQIAYLVDNDPDMRKTAEGMGVLAYSPSELLTLEEEEMRAPVAGTDKFTTEDEAADRAKAIGCEGTHSMDENGQTIYMPCSTHAAYDAIVNTDAPAYRAPAPPSDQIEGSETNDPGSATGKVGDIQLTAATETALQNKADEHNAAMKERDRPDWTRVRVGALRAVYRRGSGAFSTSHRPGIGRAQWSMARVNAFLVLARTGAPANPKYIGDNDLLNSGHPRYTEKTDRAIDPEGYTPNDAMVEEANRSLEWRRVFGRGGTLVGVARARDISERNNLPFETVRRMASFFARHEVDKEAEGFNRGEDGYPSAGRIAWGLWGGDAGRAWAASIIEAADDERAARSVEDKMGIEFRTAKVELRAVDDTGMEFEGYAALYDSPSADGTVPEIVKATAFNRSLSAVDRNEWDVRAYQDHDPKLLLGTTKSGTLSLRSDAKGLLANIKLNPDISFHRDLAAIVRSMGSSLGMSFGFWNTSSNKVNADGVRELRDVKLVEVSALTGLAPYYPGTVSLVSVRGLAAKAGVDTDELRDAVAALLAGEANEGHASILASAIAASSRDVEGVPTKFPGDEPAAEPVAEPVAEEVVEDVPAKAVPRAIRERQIQLARRAVR